MKRLSKLSYIRRKQGFRKFRYKQKIEKRLKYISKIQNKETEMNKLKMDRKSEI